MVDRCVYAVRLNFLQVVPDGCGGTKKEQRHLVLGTIVANDKVSAEHIAGHRYGEYAQTNNEATLEVICK